MKTKLYQGSELAVGAALALKHRLFVPGWDLCQNLQWLKKSTPVSAQVGIAFDGDIPVAVSILEGLGGMVMTFCRKDHRRRGYGSASLNALSLPPHAWAGEGLEGTYMFWEKHGVGYSRRHRFL